MKIVKSGAETRYPLVGDPVTDIPPIRAHITNTVWSPKDPNGNRTCSPGYVSDPTPPPLPPNKEAIRDKVIAEHLLSRVGGLAVDLFKGNLTDSVYIPSVFDPDEIANLPLPEADPDNDALENRRFLVGSKGAARFANSKARRAAYQDSPRTQVHTSINVLGGWPNAVAQRLAGYVPESEIVFSLYRSQPQDETFGLHTDTSPGLALHLAGEKRWIVDGTTLTMRPGGVLAIPAGVSHDVWTPEDPGFSVHALVSAVERVS